MIQNIDVLIRQGFPIPVAVLGAKTATKIGEIKVKKLVKKNGKKPITLIHSAEVDNVLAHFGVLGMRWGVHKEAERKASFERRAKHYENKARRIQGQINRVQSMRLAPEFKDQHIAQLHRQREQALKDAEAKRQGKLSSGQKKFLIGGGVTAAALAAYGTYRLANSGELRRSAVKGKAFLKGEKLPGWKANTALADNTLDEDGILSKVVKEINPHYGQPGTTQNCKRCTFAYEMRRRGMDVAATRTTNASGQHVGAMYNLLHPGEKELLPGGKGYHLMVKAQKPGLAAKAVELYAEHHGTNAISDVSPEGIFKALSKLPNGARGELGVQWHIGGGHSIAWEIVKGKPVIFDAQLGKKISNPDEIAKVYKNLQIAKAGFTRLDNIPLNNDFLLRWLKNAH